MLSLVAEVSGAYRLNVRSLEKGASAGRYDLRLEELRTATEADRTRVAAERAYFVAAQLQGERTGESRRKAIERYGDRTLAAELLPRAGRGELILTVGADVQKYC